MATAKKQEQQEAAAPVTAEDDWEAARKNAQSHADERDKALNEKAKADAKRDEASKAEDDDKKGSK